MIIALIYLILSSSLIVDYYRFENSYVEIWYQVPVNQLLSVEDSASIGRDTMFIKYTYRLNIYNKETNDSSYTEGLKGTCINPWEKDFDIVDYLPVSLYPGTFQYYLEIEAGEKLMTSDGKIGMRPEDIVFFCSDLILGKKNDKGDFYYHDIAFMPSVSNVFTDNDTIISFLEIYGLTPDSLYYKATYQILDSTNSLIFEKEEERLKYAYTQIDTFSIDLKKFVDGNYTFLMKIQDPVSNSFVSCTRAFIIELLFDETAKMKYYYDIQYIVSSTEFKNFVSLSEQQKKIYLKKYWAQNDYWLFEKRLLEADEKFSTSRLNGRDTHRGNFYIKYGPPDEIEDMPMEMWARPFEIWHYFSGNFVALFSDTKGDGNPVLIKTVGSGDYSRDENWLRDIAPGLHE